MAPSATCIHSLNTNETRQSIWQSWWEGDPTFSRCTAQGCPTGTQDRDSTWRWLLEHSPALHSQTHPEPCQIPCARFLPLNHLGMRKNATSKTVNVLSMQIVIHLIQQKSFSLTTTWGEISRKPQESCFEYSAHIRQDEEMLFWGVCSDKQFRKYELYEETQRSWKFIQRTHRHGKTVIHTPAAGTRVSGPEASCVQLHPRQVPPGRDRASFSLWH